MQPIFPPTYAFATTWDVTNLEDGELYDLRSIAVDTGGGSPCPLGYVGAKQDIANAVLYFASDMSSWVTGSTLVADGGGLA